MTALTAHQKQFVLGPAPVSIRPDWIAVRVAEDLVLSHCPKLPVTPLRSADGVRYWLLGLAVPADERAAYPGSKTVTRLRPVFFDRYMA